MNFAIEFAPHVAPWLLWTLAALAAVITLYLFAARAAGAWVRGLALALLLAALANPLMVRETREGLPDVVALITDHSQSMGINGRRQQADRRGGGKSKRRWRRTSRWCCARPASRCTAPRTIPAPRPSRHWARRWPTCRRSGWRAPSSSPTAKCMTRPPPARRPSARPLQALIVGKKNERDRKLTVESASRFAIVGQDADIALKVDDYGSAAGGMAQVDIRVDGVAAGSRTVEVGRTARIKVPIAHGGART